MNPTDARTALTTPAVPDATASPPLTARLALGLAALSAAAWAAKSVAIGTAGGLGLSPAEGPLFFLGLGANVAAVVCLLLVAARHRSRGQRVLVALGALPLVFLVGLVTRTAVWLLEPAEPGWVWAELNLWVAAVALLGTALVVHHRVDRRSPHGDVGADPGGPSPGTRTRVRTSGSARSRRA